MLDSMKIYEGEMARLQEDMGCKGCKFADAKMLGKGPCCTFPGKLKVEGDKCLSRRTKEDNGG